MDASLIPKGKSGERNSEGREYNEPGVYRHKDTGAEFVTAPGEEGVVQADAMMSPIWKDAWERVGDVPGRLELLKMRKAQEIKDVKEEAEVKKAEEAELKAVTDAVMAEQSKEGVKTSVGGEVFTSKFEKETAK